MQSVLEMKHISKQFPGVKALDDVTLTVGAGEIHSIVGENGAGKSTLMKILSGVYKKDSGTILLNGNSVEINTPQRAIDLGIGTVYQNLNLIPDLTVAENIYMNQYVKRAGVLIDNRAIERKTAEILHLLKCGILPSAKVGSLSVAGQQMIAIARVLAREVSVLILDEPTSSLSQEESERLFENMQTLKSRGVSIIFISHHLEEIFQYAERATVLRDGKSVGEWDIGQLNEQSLVHHMVGREVKDIFPKIPAEITEEVLSVSHLSVQNHVNDVSFSLRKGEILGIGGLVGAGRTELMKAVFGAISGRSGEIFIDGKKVNIRQPENAVQHGIAFVPEDRRGEGLLTEFSILDNVGLCNLKRITKAGIVQKAAEEHITDQVIREMDVKTPSRRQLVKNLSGGNQQKIVLGKWFLTNPRIMIFDEPTRGIDVGAKSEIHRKIGELAKQGLGIIVVSSELPELMGISDRIIVLCKGQMTGEFTRGEFSAEQIMLAATSTKI